MRKTILALALLLTGCADEQATQVATDPPERSIAPAAIQECENRTPPAPATEDQPGETKPKIEIPDSAPPCELVSQDIHVGDGAEAEEGATVTVQYVGVSWSTQQEFDSSWDRGEPATFPLSQVVQGWQEGIPGMKEGGRRQLIIPPDLAYGATGRRGIAPNETLVFVIDLISAG
jgi:peptidylprolyl isomerase